MNASLEDVYAELADEHKRIFSLVARLSETGAQLDLVPLLEQLHELLVNHFSHEQFPGGLYEQLGARGAEHGDQLKVLIREHCEILSSISALVERARAAGTESELELREQTARVIEKLEQHEMKEHRLAESLLRDE